MPPLKVGVLLVGQGVQYLDTAAVDLFAMSTKSYLQPLCDDGLIPKSVSDKGTDMQFLYISEQGANTTFALTAGAGLRMTSGFADVGQLDYLIVPGPSPDYVPTPAEKAFIVNQFPGLTLLMGICTGTLVLADAGVLDGLVATGPRTLLSMYRAKWPKVQWVEKRWETAAAGKVWTSGAVTNGNDAISAYLRASLDKDLAETVIDMADVGDRSQFYANSESSQA